jgi:hypothetical protein
MPSVVVGDVALRNEAQNWTPWVWSLIQRYAGLHERAGRHHRRMTEDGDEVPLTAGFDPQHAEPILFVVEGDALDDTGQGLDRRARLQCLRYQAMMEF